MAKSKNAGQAFSPNASPGDGPELIIQLQSDAPSSVAATPSTRSKKVSSFQNILKGYNASLIPVFGVENRAVPSSSKQKAPSSEAVSDLVGFYKVEAEGNLQEIANELLQTETVAAAYVKPLAEPPVRRDEENEVPFTDAPPVTPNFVPRQLYLEVAPGGIDARYAWTLPGGKGDSVRIIDIEGAWRFTHEDLIANQGGVIGGTQSTNIDWRNHGTAVVGEFGGDENTFGITGICPNANVRAISIFGPGMGSSVAIRQAADALNAGDIILIELHRPGPQFNFVQRADQRGYIAIEWWPDDFAAIRYAISRGVIVVEAAGNGAENLDAGIYNNRPAGFPVTWTNPFNLANPQSGATIVGAGAPPPGTHGRNHGTDRSRLDFSNWGARVDVQGWGREVTTCGYGDLQGGSEDIWYTDTFSGTSSASPIVVGALGCIQGRLRARSRPLLTPATATNLLRTTGSPQQSEVSRPASQRIGNRPNLRQAFENLSIGGSTKTIVKDLKDRNKDRKDTKEKDIKEFKEKEIKEFKERKEFKEKEFKEFKEREKEIKEFNEGKLIRENFDFIKTASSEDASSIEQRLTNLESTLESLSHFISSDIRPDLQGNLFKDPLSETDKNTSDVKIEKELKDTSDI